MALMKTLKPGESFYIGRTAKQVQAYASKLGVHIRTKTCLLIEDYGEQPLTLKIQKVTILWKQTKEFFQAKDRI